MERIVGRGLFLFKTLHDRFLPVKTDLVLPGAETLGNHGASFTVDLQSLNASSIIYSFGVGSDISFDLELIKKTGAFIHAFDPTPGSAEWLKAQELPEKFMFEMVGIAAEDGEADFYPPENPNYISHTLIKGTGKRGIPFKAKMERLSTIMKRLGHDHIDLLKMDVEGAEYEVIENILQEGISIRQIAVEFHHRFKSFHPFKTKRAVKMLRDKGYKVFSVSANGEEVGFVRV